MRLITIQEISSRFPQVHEWLMSVGRNNYKNLFFISDDSPISEPGGIPSIYMLMSDGRLCVSINRYGRVFFRYLHDRQFVEQLLEEGRRAVAGRHSYLRETLECIESALGLHPTNALF